jgi:c-di-GMP-binding flagellar brake protein YcgR
METLPLPLDAIAAQGRGLAEFRVASPAEVLALLKQLADANIALTLSTPEGATCSATVWALDPQRGLLCLSANVHDVQLQSLLESEEVVAVGYLDSVKLQFDLHDIVLVRGHNGSALNVRFPRELYRFQRRGSFRVRPLLSTRPVARLRHPALPDMALELRVVDVSIGGIALFLPEDVPEIEPGVCIEQVVVELDGDTRFTVSLTLHHVTLLHHESKGVRLGCGMGKLGGEGERLLQRYIDLTQRRRRQLVL